MQLYYDCALRGERGCGGLGCGEFSGDSGGAFYGDSSSEPEAHKERGGILGLDFTTLCEDDLLSVLAMRNDERVARFMYARHISKNAHREFIASLRANAKSKYWLFKYAETRLGVGSLSRISLSHSHAYIGIYTNPFLLKTQKREIYAASGFGSVGEMILCALESGARELGLHALYLEVLESNAHARGFYERHGYKPQGRLEGYMRLHPESSTRESNKAESSGLDSSGLSGGDSSDTSQCFANVCIYGKLLDPAPLDSGRKVDSSKADSYKVDSRAPESSPLDSAKAPTRPLLVAEISANHNQSLRLAKHTIKAAALAGADFVKLQTYTPECLTMQSDKPYFRIDSGTLWDGRTLYDLYQQAYTPFAWHAELFAYARSLGVGIFSSPFSSTALELLERLSCPMYKIASFEITDTPFISLVASTQKPIIISTGIASHAQILDALEACHKVGNANITLLLCTSSYPAPLDSACLRAMPKLARYGVRYGLSDHTQGDICALLAAGLGASMIEKHFIIRRSLGGVDSAFSMEAREFAHLARKLSDAALALGDGDLDKKLESSSGSSIFARSLFVVENIKQGQILSAQNIRSIRPAHGLAPKYLAQILGKRASRDLQAGEPLCAEDFE